MNIAGWPFIVVVDGDMQAGAAARITIDFQTSPSSDTVEQVQYGIESFIALAEAGGLGGDRLNPLQSTAAFSTAEPMSKGARYAWELAVLAIDPRALSILFNMMTFLGSDIQGVAVQTSSPGSSASFTTDDLPPMWPNIPFEYEDDRTGPNVEVQIGFAQGPSVSQHEKINDAIETWLGCGSAQGYRDWSGPSDSSFLVPTDYPVFKFVDDSFEGQFQDMGLREECYGVFINVLAKLHAETPILSVEIV